MNETEPLLPEVIELRKSRKRRKSKFLAVAAPAPPLFQCCSRSSFVLQLEIERRRNDYSIPNPLSIS